VTAPTPPPYTSATSTGTAHLTGTLNGSAIGTAGHGHASSPARPTQHTRRSLPRRRTVVADGSATSTLTVRVKDVNDNQLAAGGATVVLATDRGTLSSVTDNGDGTYTATADLRPRPAPRMSPAPSAEPRSATPVTVTFTTGCAERRVTRSLAVAPGSLVATGASTATVTVRIYDVNDNAASRPAATSVTDRDRPRLALERHRQRRRHLHRHLHLGDLDRHSPI
jgi:adhesin/invasin